MTRETLIRKLRALSDEEFATIAPYLEADLASAGVLAELQREIAAGRRSARTQPLLKAQDVYRRVRNSLRR